MTYRIVPDMAEHFGMCCINSSNVPITCTGFAFNPNISNKTGSRIMPNLTKSIVQNIHNPNTINRILQYGDKAEIYFNFDVLDKRTLQSFLSRHMWIAKLQLKYFWKVVATTNVKEFEGKLSNDLVEKIISIHFSN